MLLAVKCLRFHNLLWPHCATGAEPALRRKQLRLAEFKTCPASHHWTQTPAAPPVVGWGWSLVSCHWGVRAAPPLQAGRVQAARENEALSTALLGKGNLQVKSWDRAGCAGWSVLHPGGPGSGRGHRSDPYVACPHRCLTSCSLSSPNLLEA